MKVCRHAYRQLGHVPPSHLTYGGSQPTSELQPTWVPTRLAQLHPADGNLPDPSSQLTGSSPPCRCTLAYRQNARPSCPPPPPPPGLSHREEGRLGWPPWGEVCPCLGCRRATVAPAAWLVSASSAAPRWCGGPRQGLHQLQSMTSDTGAALAGHLLHSAVLLPCTANCCSNCWLRPAGDLRWSCRWKLGHFGAGQTEASDTWLTTDWMSVGGQAESKSMLRGGRASLS